MSSPTLDPPGQVPLASEANGDGPPKVALFQEASGASELQGPILEREAASLRRLATIIE